MTLKDLILAARQESTDLAEPYLWSDLEWTRYANDAEREACRRSRLIVDSKTAGVCTLSLTTAETVALDPRVLFIRRAKLATATTPLRRLSYRDLDRNLPGWEDVTGEPYGYVPDMHTALFRPYPTPTVSTTVNLTVVRLPLNDMANNVDEPEIHIRYHESLVFWMLYRAYSKQDSETLDKQKAAANLALFEAEFGKKSTAIDETWIEREHGYTDEEGVF